MELSSTQTALLLSGAAYLAGSVNFAIIVLRLFGKGDPRTWSSGNPGVTNVYRQHGLLWAGSILLLDMGRSAAIAWLAARCLAAAGLPWIALALLLGNKYPLFHGFRGGKGVANLLGFTAALTPPIALLGGVAWLALYRLSKEAFIGSLAMVAVLASGLATRCGWSAVALAGIGANIALVVLNHYPNIRRKWGRAARAKSTRRGHRQ